MSKNTNSMTTDEYANHLFAALSAKPTRSLLKVKFEKNGVVAWVQEVKDPPVGRGFWYEVLILNGTSITPRHGERKYFPGIADASDLALSAVNLED